MARLSIPALFQPTVLLALALLAVIVMMILPVPTWVLDIGLAASFAIAILIFTITLFIERPLDFSSFPTLLLASLMLRLSLNVSSTKLIIGNGHTGPQAAGHVIEGFAMFIMSGSVLIGLVVFGVLLIVNFIVITKGAGRMAEVSARFALDAMPGRQLAIDSDMSAGAIDHAEARVRREREQAETTFFGSLDGASKFVKGDAVAGLLITFLNLIVGLLIGTAVHGLPLGQAFETYAILTVGDGLVTQIPAVIISIASALLLARGGSRGSADSELLRQLGQYPPALATVGVLMVIFALVPGLPFVPFVSAAAILGTAAFLLHRRRRPRAAAADPPAATPPPRPRVGDLLDLDDIHVEFAPDLVAMALDSGTGLDARIVNMRNHIAATYGIILPEIRLTDDAGLGPGEYRIRVQGVEQARDRLLPDRVLALMPPDEAPLPAGIEVREPVYGAPARWIDPRLEADAALAGATVVSPSEILATHLLEVIRRNLGRLLTLRALRRMIDELGQVSDPARADANRKLFDELIPDKVPVELLLAVLRLLLDEKVSIRNLPVILESIAEGRGLGPADAVAEHVRRRLAFQIVGELRRPDGTIAIVQLAPEWEAAFAAHQIESERALPEVALPPDLFNRLTASVADRVARAAERGQMPAVVTAARRRRFLRSALAARGIPAPVLSYDELGTDAKPSIVGLVPA